jgi:hypothetical protein
MNKRNASFATGTAFLWILYAVNPAMGQGATVQLPIMSVFNIRTAVMVPDGGSIAIGGNTTGAFSSTRRGVPGLMGRGLGNRAIGSSLGSSQQVVTVKVLDLKEMEQAVIAEGERRLIERSATNPNGNAETQSRAQFMSQNIGRNKRR